MSITQYLAARYMKSHQENRFFSWITVLTAMGIAIGTAALIVVISVINGFEFELRKRFLHANAHIMAFRYPVGMSEPDKWIDIIKNDFGDKVTGISPFIHNETMVKHNAIMHGGLIRGLAPKVREHVQSLEGLIQPASALQLLQQEYDDSLKGLPPPKIPSVILGDGLMGLIDAKIGDTVALVAPGKEASRLVEYKVVGNYNSGLKHYDNRLVYMSLSAAQNFFDMGKTVTGLEIGLKDHMRSVEIKEQMEEKYKLTFREWQSFNKPLFETLKRDRFLIVVVVAMVILVAAFNILTTVFVSVSQKQKDISILKAIGATNKQIISMFIYQSVYIGVSGGIAGGVLAVVVSWFLEKYMPLFLELPDPYFLRTLPIHNSPGVYFTVISASILLSILAAIYPAIIASRVEPSAGFRGNAGVV